MTKLSFKLDTFDTIRTNYTAEQILRQFNIVPDENSKILCPMHQEKTPSCHVYESHIYCYGCNNSADNFDLAKVLLERECNCTKTVPQVLAWFEDTQFTEKSGRKYQAGSKYVGAVNRNLIDYWHSQMDDEKYRQIYEQRLIRKDTAQLYHLGWRPEVAEWVIPFWRDTPGHSEVDIVQFRKTDNTEPKYIGLSSHNRGSIMNAHLLKESWDYLVILFGAYDPILALQDGIIAVGTNGSFPFKKEEKERVQELFSKQRNVLIVPDNTPAEYKSAYKMAEWLNAEVRFFDTELPDGCDYIDYRKLGFTAVDFGQDVLGIQPITQIPGEYLSDIKDYIQAGDPCQLASVYAIMNGRGLVATDVARTLAKEVVKPFSEKNWPRKKLWSVRTEDDLVKTLNSIAVEANRLTGAW